MAGGWSVFIASEEIIARLRVVRGAERRDLDDMRNTMSERRLREAPKVAWDVIYLLTRDALSELCGSVLLPPLFRRRFDIEASGVSSSSDYIYVLCATSYQGSAIGRFPQTLSFTHILPG